MQSRFDPTMLRRETALRSEIAAIEAEILRVVQQEVTPIAERMRLAQASSDRSALYRARAEYNRWSFWLNRRRATCEAKKKELSSLLSRR
jgi:hypothetical protein